MHINVVNVVSNARSREGLSHLSVDLPVTGDPRRASFPLDPLDFAQDHPEYNRRIDLSPKHHGPKNSDKISKRAHKKIERRRGRDDANRKKPPPPPAPFRLPPL